MALIRKLALALLLLAVPAVAQNIAPVHGDCSQGNTAVLTQGLQSTNRVMASYPACTVTVYDHGTTNLSTIYSDSSFTLLANPFTATALGNWIFYAFIGTSTPDRYDVVMSGGLNGGFPAPYTIADIYLWAGAGGGGGGLIPCGVPNDIQVFLNSTNLGCDTGIATLDPSTHTLSDNILNANHEVDVSDPTTTGLIDLGHSNGTAVDAHFLFGPSPTFSTSGGGYGISPPDAAPTNVGYALTVSSLTPVGGLLPTAWTTVAGGVTSIQMVNGGVNFGSPMTGAGSLNCVGCTWSGTTPNFTLTVPSGLSVAGNSGDMQTNNGASNLGAGHINDNGTTMTVTESLTPSVAAAHNLGTAPLPFGDGYFGGAANHSFHFDTSSVASNVTVAIPNHASNTVQGISDPSDTEAVNYIGTDGVQHRISISASGVTSIQPENNGTPYGSPLTGAITMNFANCTVSATFTITCSGGASGGSSGDLQTNNGSGGFGAAHINDNTTTMTVTESITPLVAAANNLGTAPLPFGDGYFGGAANHSFHFDTSSVASNVAVAIPNHASNTVQGISDPSDTEAVNYISTDGVQHRIVVTGLPSGTGVVRVDSSSGSAAELSGAVSTSGSNVTTLDPQFTTYSYGACTNTADALTMTPTDTPTSLADGLTVACLSSAANTTTTPTLKVGTLAAKTIVKAGTSGQAALVANDILTNMVATFKYNATATTWELQNPQQASGASGITSITGPADLSTWSVIGGAATQGKANAPTDVVWSGPPVAGLLTPVVRQTKACFTPSGGLVGTCAFDADTAQHSTIFLTTLVNTYSGGGCTSGVQGAISALTLSDGTNSYTEIDTNYDSSAYFTGDYYAKDAVGGPVTVTITATAPGGTSACFGTMLTEIANTDTTSPLDQHGTSGSADFSTLTTTANNDIVLGAAYIWGYPAVYLFTALPGWPLTIPSTSDSSVYMTVVEVGAVAPIAGTYTPVVTDNDGIANPRKFTVAFKAASSGGGSQPWQGQYISQEMLTRSVWPNLAGIVPAATATGDTGIGQHVGNHILSTDRTTAYAGNDAPSTLYLTTSASGYTCHVYVKCNTSVSTATVIPSLIYTSDDSASTVETITGGTAACTTLGTSDVVSMTQELHAKAATTIYLETTLLNSPHYNTDAFCELHTTQ